RVPNLGESLPLYVGVAGWVFLADESPDEVEAYIRRTQENPPVPTSAHDSWPPVDRAELLEDIARTRGRGYGEWIRRGDRAQIAAPVRGHGGAVVAAVKISGPMERYNAAARERWVRASLAAGESISEALGHSAE